MSSSSSSSGPIIHKTAEVSDQARIGARTRIWHGVQVREGAIIGVGCVVGKDAYIDADVIVGDHCKIQNGAYLYKGVVLEDGVFIGPRVTTTNDRTPRAVNPDGSPKGLSDWVIVPTRIRRGAAIGAGAVLVCGIEIGAFAMVAAGSVVTRDVPPLGLVMGNPARLRGAVCPCGARLRASRCGACGRENILLDEVAKTL